MKLVHFGGSELPELSARIEKNLLASLALENLQSENSTFGVAMIGDDGDLVGGLVASSSYGWLLLKILWIADAFRRKGVGTRLVAAAETKGRHFNCHSAWLDTSSVSANKFYASLGYLEFGVLANKVGQHPENHQRWFMQKTL